MKILNFGSINIDYTYHVEHFVRPGETLLSAGRQTFSGGKGFNQSLSLAKAGATVYHAGRISKEDTFLIEELREAGVKTDFVEQCDMYTGHAIIQIDTNGQNCIILSSGANYSMTEQFIDSVLAQFEAGDILLLQNEINMIDVIMNKAYAKGMQIALNPSPINDELLRYPLEKVRYFLLNEIEGQELSGSSDKAQMAERLLEKYPQSAIVLTLGKQGVVYLDAKERSAHGIYDVKVVDTTAAGDTFTGYFLASVCGGLPVSEALRRASVASSISVSRNGAGVSIPYAKEVLSAIETGSLGNPT